MFFRNLIMVIMFALMMGCDQEGKQALEEHSASLPYVIDMVYNNPGEALTQSAYNNPSFLKDRGFNGMVGHWYVNCAIDYDGFEAGIIPKGSEESNWIEQKAEWIDERLAETESAGIEAYAFTDVFVAPRSLWEKYGDEMGSQETGHSSTLGGEGKKARRPNIQYPMIEKLIKAQISGIFDRFTDLDGLVIRFGETYLHDTPFHMGGKPVREGEEGIKDHVKLLNILREEICVKRNKKLFYRTWDFGWFHTQPDVYLAITNQVEPHENLIFSIKHTKGDFLRTFPFNPTLGIGKHDQIVEVQCQREYEGKGAHPNYIAGSVLNGFEEFEGQEGPQGLNDIKDNPQLKGVWTWSRGGGWKGPYIKNELWPDLNAYVLGRWANNMALEESELVIKYAMEVLGMDQEDAKRFQKIAELSPKGVLLGRSSKLTRINPWWIRDQFMGGVTTDEFNDFTEEAWGKTNEDFERILAEGIEEEIIEEKKQAVDIWKQIEVLAQEVKSGDEKAIEYLQVSSSYGRIKYSIIQVGWEIMLRGLKAEKTGNWTEPKIETLYEEYRSLWVAFKDLKNDHPESASLYLPYSFMLGTDSLHGEEGMEKAVNHYLGEFEEKSSK
ncbi:hypothetical protein [Echinicola salinicaeni]|uniref:hypothetical protein n=1 Tax=Echinicola salinicaeni TaxID=2762757 RepID=UPI001645210C|nr:hypothetical protein [Echinicola salinicaeni]